VNEAATRADAIKLFSATACPVWQDALYSRTLLREVEFFRTRAIGLQGFQDRIC
jgi:hypothetical protein